MPGSRNKEGRGWWSFIKPGPSRHSRHFSPLLHPERSHLSDSAAEAESIVHAQCPKQMAGEDTGQTKGGLGFFA